MGSKLINGLEWAGGTSFVAGPPRVSDKTNPSVTTKVTPSGAIMPPGCDFLVDDVGFDGFDSSNRELLMLLEPRIPTLGHRFLVQSRRM